MADKERIPILESMFKTFLNESEIVLESLQSGEYDNHPPETLQEFANGFAEALKLSEKSDVDYRALNHSGSHEDYIKYQANGASIVKQLRGLAATKRSFSKMTVFQLTAMPYTSDKQQQRWLN